METNPSLYGQVVDHLLYSWSTLDRQLKQTYIQKSKKYRRKPYRPEYFSRAKLQSDREVFKVKEEAVSSCNPEDFFDVLGVVNEIEELKELLKIEYNQENKIVFFAVSEESEYDINFYEPNEGELDYYTMKYYLESYTLLTFEEFRQKNALKVWKSSTIVSPNEVATRTRRLMNYFATNNPVVSYSNIKEILLNEKPSVGGLFRIYCNINQSSRTQAFYEYLKRNTDGSNTRTVA